MEEIGLGMVISTCYSELGQHPLPLAAVENVQDNPRHWVLEWSLEISNLGRCVCYHLKPSMILLSEGDGCSLETREGKIFSFATTFQ